MQGGYQMNTTNKDGKETHHEDWLSLFRCCSRDPEQIARMVKALKRQLSDNSKKVTSN